MDKRFLLILTALAVLFGGIFWFNKSKAPAPGTGTNAKPSSHVLGNNTKGVTLVEYGDYQCPACSQFAPIVNEIKKTYNDQILFRFANFPLVQIHPNAMISARAAEAAALQGKFWEMHDILYQEQQTWSTASSPKQYFDQYAKSLNLDIAKFDKDMASSAVLGTIDADTAEVQALGGDSTPTFVINGKRLEKNPNSVEEFKKIIDQAIKDAAKNKQ